MNTAFIINGGAGRVLCAIPALEIYEASYPNDDFIIVVEYWIDLFKGHPTLYKRCFDAAHKNLFEDKIKSRQIVAPEPYQLWEYYNQKASIAQGFDIAINHSGLRPIHRPSIYLSNAERNGGVASVNAIRKEHNKKIIVFQPFGRGSAFHNNEIVDDVFGKSFFISDVINIIKNLQAKYTILLMSESTIEFDKLDKSVQVAQIPNLSVRQWMAIINASDYFLGCDSLGQHIAYSLNKPATVVLGSTFKENVSYPNVDNFNIVDVGEDKKEYSPLRVCYDTAIDINNENLMRLNQHHISDIITLIENAI